MSLAEIVNKIRIEPALLSTKLFTIEPWTPELLIETLAKRIYGAEAVDYTPQAKPDLEKVYSLGLDVRPYA